MANFRNSKTFETDLQEGKKITPPRWGIEPGSSV